jgi:hypothetical protein
MHLQLLFVPPRVLDDIDHVRKKQTIKPSGNRILGGAESQAELEKYAGVPIIPLVVTPGLRG